MVKKLVFLLVLLMILPLANALDTPINVKTLSEHKVIISVLDSEDSHLLESFIKTSDSNGDISVAYSSSGAGEIDVAITVSKDGQEVLYERFEGYPIGKLISVRIDYDDVNRDYDPNPQSEKDSTVNDSINESRVDGELINTSEEVTADEVNEDMNGAPITGDVVSNSKSSASRIIYFSIAGLLIVLTVMFFIVRKNSLKNKFAIIQPKTLSKSNIKLAGNNISINPRPSSLSEGNVSIRPSSLDKSNIVDAVSGGPSRDDEIQMLEIKIKDFQKEINQLKNEEKIREAEKKLEADKRELDRLKGSY